MATKPEAKQTTANRFNGRKSLGAKVVPEKQSVSTGRKSLPATTVIKADTKVSKPVRAKIVPEKQSVSTGRRSLPVTTIKKAETKVSKPVARSVSAKQSKSAPVPGSSTGRNMISARISLSGIVAVPIFTPKQIQTVTAGRKSLAATTGKGNSKSTQPINKKNPLGRSASGNLPFTCGKDSTRVNTQHNGATNNSSKLQTKNIKPGAVPNKKSNVKPRRSILKPCTETKITSNAPIGIVPIEEVEEIENEEMTNKENVKDDRIEIIKQTSKSVHFISPCKTPRMKTAGETPRVTPLKAPTKELSMK